MILDLQLQLSAAQAFTTTAVSTNTVDVSAIDPDLAPGEPLALVLTVDVAADFTTTDETYQLNLIGDDDPALGSPVVLQEMIIAAADLAAGAMHVMPIAQNRMTERYLGAQMVLAGTTPSVTASISIQPLSMAQAAYRSYAKGYTIS